MLPSTRVSRRTALWHCSWKRNFDITSFPTSNQRFALHSAQINSFLWWHPMSYCRPQRLRRREWNVIDGVPKKVFTCEVSFKKMTHWPPTISESACSCSRSVRRCRAPGNSIVSTSLSECGTRMSLSKLSKSAAPLGTLRPFALAMHSNTTV